MTASASSLHLDGSALKGIGLAVVATLAFASSDALGKHLVSLYPVPAVMAVRYTVNVILLLAFLLPRHGRMLWRTQRTGLVVLRGACLAAASLTMGWALQRMPLGETVSILYLSPFLVMLVAIPLLGEKVPIWGWIGALAGFAGVLLIVRPGAGLDPIGVVFALTNAGIATAYALLTRFLARTETTISMVFDTALVGMVVFVFLGANAFPSHWPPLGDVGRAILLGVLATVGHFVLTMAYREAPASLVAPVGYMHLVWAGLLSWVFFAHVPDGLSLSGMALIALAGAGVALNTHLEKRRAARITDPVA